MRTHLAIALFMTSTLVGCVDPDLDVDLDVTEPPTTEPAAVCGVPPTPPPADTTWTFTGNGDQKTLQRTSYGTGQCAKVTFAYRNATHVTGSVVGELNSQKQCEETTVTARIYSKDSAGAWSLVKTQSAAGTWAVNANPCREPEISYYVPTAWNGTFWLPVVTAEIRVYMSAQRTSCTNGPVPLCGTTYGLPVESTGHLY